MRTKEKYLVIAFETTENALFAEKICKSDNRNGRIIPLPKAVSAGCGLCWASKENLDKNEWEYYLKSKNISFQKILEVEF